MVVDRDGEQRHGERARHRADRYNYDAIGNLTEKEGVTFTHDVLHPHRIVGTTSGQSFTYHDGGEVATILNSSGQGRTFGYDAAGRLGSVNDGVSGWTATQTYNPQGERVKRVESSGGVATTTYFVGKLYDAQGTSHNDYVYLAGERIAEIRATAETLEVFYLLNDHLGSVNVVTDHTGAFVQRLAWNPYGELRQAEGQSFSAAFPFAGARRDPGLGLDDFGARFYDPRFGRFLSLDPLMVDPLDLDVQNPYAYAKWNPMSYVDIGGLHHGEKSGFALFYSTSWGGALGAPGLGGSSGSTETQAAPAIALMMSTCDAPRRS